jgi:hypothetical protein
LKQKGFLKEMIKELMCLDLEYECIVGIKQNKKYKLKKFKVKVKKMPRK